MGEGLVAGVDGCRAGWVALLVPLSDPSSCTALVRRNALALFSALSECSVIAIDIPIGVPLCVAEYPREADRLARRALTPKGSRVFNVPPWDGASPEVGMGPYTKASLARVKARCGIGTSLQLLNIVDRIADVAAVLDADEEMARTAFEIHPECSFALAQGTEAAFSVVEASKRSPEGRDARSRLLSSMISASALATALDVARTRGVGIDDALDAGAAAWTARRIAHSQAMRLPSHPSRSAIWV